MSDESAIGCHTQSQPAELIPDTISNEQLCVLEDSDLLSISHAYFFS